jgi:hypothetical protein
MTLGSEAWLEANQERLMAAVACVREAIERHATDPAHRDSAPAPTAASLDTEPDSAAFGASALDTVVTAFGLSPFERDVLVMCAGMELDASFASFCGTGQSGAHRVLPTFGMALASLPGAHWSALSPAAPLRRYRLVEPTTSDLITQSPLRIDERVLHYLAGISHLDARLEGLVQRAASSPPLAPSQEEPAQRIAVAWSSWSGAAAWPVIQLVGDSPDAARAVAARACLAVGLGLYLMRSSDVPGPPDEREAFVRLWARESVLESSALLLEADDVELAERARLRALAERVPGPLLIASREPLATGRRTDLRVDVARPLPDEQLSLWRAHLGDASTALDGRLDRLVAQFNLEADTIQSACAAIALTAPNGTRSGVDDLGERIWDACRAQTRARLDQLAQRIVPTAGWDDLVLPREQQRVLVEIAAQVHQRSRVYGTWGLGGVGRRGLGVTALFAGPSGTGKTMAAEVLAGELRLDLFRIDLSQVVSKYIGETEKNLRRVFDAAEGGGAILLFDEADALFGKRSEVHDSHDRYANIEISYLLQRMEEYHGLALLTTNLKTALDPAFVRRLRFIVGFPFPDVSQREELWRRAFSPRTPTEGLDPVRLARLNVAGGDVRNIALRAAFLAAEAEEPVRMRHLLTAARGEYAKLEKTLTASEVEGWV